MRGCLTASNLKSAHGTYGSGYVDGSWAVQDSPENFTNNTITSFMSDHEFLFIIPK